MTWVGAAAASRAEGRRRCRRPPPGRPVRAGLKTGREASESVVTCLPRAWPVCWASLSTAGDRSGMRGDGGKQFVDQIVDRDQLKIPTASGSTCHSGLVGDGVLRVYPPAEGGRTSRTAPSWMTALRWCTATSSRRKLATTKTRASASPRVAVKVATRSSTVVPSGSATRSEPVPAAALAPPKYRTVACPVAESAHRVVLLRSPFVGRHLQASARRCLVLDLGPRAHPRWQRRSSRTRSRPRRAIQATRGRSSPTPRAW